MGIQVKKIKELLKKAKNSDMLYFLDYHGKEMHGSIWIKPKPKRGN